MKSPFDGLRIVTVIAASAMTTACLAREADSTATGWMVLARSMEDRAIEYRQFGEGKTEVLVVGPFEGDETAALALIEQLADHLERFPRSAAGVRVTIVRDPNPDGRLRRSPFNARGVQLNRNFAASNWHKLPSGSNWLSGREPESEAETRAVADLLTDLRADRVVLLAATRHNAELAYAGPGESLARELAKATGLRPTPVNVAAEPGSLAAYAGQDRKLPTVVVRVPVGLRGDQLWSTYKRGLLAVLGADEPSDSPAPTKVAGDVPRPTATFAAKTSSAPPADANGTQGVLKAEDLEFGGELVPIERPTAPAGAARQATVKKSAPQTASGKPHRQIGPAMPPDSAPAGPLFAQPNAAAQSSAFSKPRGQATLAPSPSSSAPASSNTHSTAITTPRPIPNARPNGVERLPKLDSSSAAKQSLPQPIPFYPETGY